MSTHEKNRLFLLDGMALLYRAHFAFVTNPIRNSKGMNTSALYGFLNTLLLIQDAGKPTHLACAFDTSEPTDRHKLYPEYKAQRQAMPEELSAQIPHIFRLLEALRIPIVRLPGYEADDSIGTLAKQAESTGEYLTYMVTPDKDFGQLVDKSTYIWKPGRKGAEYSIIDLPTLLQEWEIQSPSQVIDILGLMGDASDNIPGVPGIGPKTAKELIAQFGSIETILENTAQLKGKRRETLESNADKARLSKILATINTQVPIPLALEELICKTPDESLLTPLLQEFEFKTLAKRFLPANTSSLKKNNRSATSSPPQKTGAAEGDLLPLFGDISSSPTKNNTTDTESPLMPGDDLFAYAEEQNKQLCLKTVDHSYLIIQHSDERKTLVEKLLHEPQWCFDTETTGLNPLTDSLLGISFCITPHTAYYVTIKNKEELQELAPAFHSSGLKIGHNLKFDLSILRANGIVTQGPFMDTMIAHALITPGHKHSMDYLAETLLNYQTIKLADIAPKIDGTLETKNIPLEILGQYAAEDADITAQLAEILTAQLTDLDQLTLYKEVEAPLIDVLAHCELEGINVDPLLLSRVSHALSEEIITLRTHITEEAGCNFNLNSPKQLGNILFDTLKLVAKPKKTKTGQYVTDEETLNTLAHAHPIINKILAYREASKLKSTYVDALPRFISPVDHRIHTQYLQLITATGRMASQEPNLQNIPIRSQAGKGVRAAFIPRNSDYLLLSADYSQVELRIMAALSGDKNLIEAFNSGRDIHTETAALLYGTSSAEITKDQRRAAKTVNFGIIFGISAFGLSQRLGIPRGQAAVIIESYFQQFPGVKSFMDQTIAQAKECGYVATLNNRRRYLPEIYSLNANIRQGAERMAINTPIQGTAADMMKIAMIRVHQLLEKEKTHSKLLLQIHDELVLDLHKDEHILIPEIISIMENALPLPHEVPLLVEARTGTNWFLAH